MNKRKAARILFGLLGAVLSLLGLLFVFFYRDVDPGKIALSIHRIRVGPLVLALVIYWGGTVVTRSRLIRHLLRPIGDIKASKAYKYICVGYLANDILPLRMGEIIRITGIAKSAGLGVTPVIGGLALERALDIFMLSIIGVLAITFAPLPPSVRIAVIAAGVCLAVAFGAMIFLARRTWDSPAVQPKNRVVAFAVGLLAKMSRGFWALRTTKGIFVAALLSASTWTLMLISLLPRLAAFGIEPSPAIALVLLASLGGAVSLPSAPGFVGTYHTAAAAALAVCGVDWEIALGFAFFSHLVDIVPGSIAGAISLTLEGISFGDLRRAADRKETV